jgi:hypothetical protein
VAQGIEVEMTDVSKEDSFAHLERKLSIHLDTLKAYTTASEIVLVFAREHPEQDVREEIKHGQGWVDDATARIGSIKGFLQEKTSDAALAFVMGQHRRLGDKSLVRELPETIVAMIFSKPHFY